MNVKSFQIVYLRLVVYSVKYGELEVDKDGKCGLKKKERSAEPQVIDEKGIGWVQLQFH